MSTYYEQTFSPFIVTEESPDIAHSERCAVCERRVGYILWLQDGVPFDQTHTDFWLMDEDGEEVWCHTCMSNYEKKLAQEELALEVQYARYLWENDRNEYRYVYGDADFIYEEDTTAEPF